MTRPRDIADSINRINSSAADATAVTIDANENVGIGATPNAYSGFTTVTIGGSGKSDLDFETNGTVKASLFTEDSQNDFNVSASTGCTLVLQSNGNNDRMRLDTGGTINIVGDSFGLISNGGQAATTLADDAAINLTVSGTATAGGGLLCVYETASGENAIYHVGYNRGNLISNSNSSLFATGSTDGKNTIQVSGHQITFTNRTGSSRNYVFNLFIAGGSNYNQ